MKVPLNDESFEIEDDMNSLMNERAEGSHQKSKRNPVVNCIVTGIAHVQYFWIHHRPEFILGLILLSAVSLAVTGVIEVYEKGHHNPNKHTIAHDYSQIKSELELKIGGIDHWCLDGKDDSCQCDDPTKAISRADSKSWVKVFKRNTRISKYFLENIGQPDVVFLGGSNTEARAGTYRGDTLKKDSSKQEEEGEVGEGKLEETLRKSKNKFDKYFKKAAGGAYNGLALGIAGDTSPNLLWRIQQGETTDLRPKVWWVSIGSNDFLHTSCSEEVALMGILRVVEELIHKNDGATIVINSILPVATRSSLSLEGNHVRNKYWAAIKLVNERLKRFAKNHTGVRFFDATDILTEYHGKNRYMIKDMFVDKVHLSAAGQAALAEAQAGVMKAVLQKAPFDGATTNAEAETDVSPDNYGYPGDDYVDDWIAANFND